MKIVYVGMSGGVDSSVTAAVLVQRGYKVVGVYMKNWTKDLPGMVCPWMEDYQDAKRVAVQLGIDFKVYDFQKQYKHKVVDYMIKEYSSGRTPNPDIMCNQEVKFKLFLETALEDGADMIATGHYARVLKSQKENQKSELHIAANIEKDQTYFLYRVTESALSKSLMPIGEIKSKSEVRSIAKKLGLATADKKDSQGICFVGSVGIREFLEQYVELSSGAIINQDGLEVGTHDGAIFYTIGQRHGLNVGGGLPYYVIGKSMNKNEVYVTNNIDDTKLWNSEFTITDAHWINNPPVVNQDYNIRTRYRAELVKSKINLAPNSDKTNPKYIFTSTQMIRAITPGQSVVVYDGNRVVGGGIIT